MTEHSNTNSGVLFRNERKNTDKHPDYTGSLNVGGTEYWVSGWIKVSRKGQKFMSLAVNTKNGAGAGSITDFDDDIPF